jgi:ABC-type Fe3+ transport system permease subunit
MTAIPPPAAAYPEKSQATTALVLSILGLLCCGILRVVGAVMGNTEKQAIAAGRRDASNQGMAQAAFIIGIIGAALWVLAIIFNATVLPGLFEGLPVG